jgi:hypothetical protein
MIGRRERCCFFSRPDICRERGADVGAGDLDCHLRADDGDKADPDDDWDYYRGAHCIAPAHEIDFLIRRSLERVGVVRPRTMIFSYTCSRGIVCRK